MTGRAAELERFYREHSGDLKGAVGAQVHTTDHIVIDDACQHAWLALTRRTEIALDERGAAWLTTVAIREGWRLARLPRAIPSGPFRGGAPVDAGERPDPPALHHDPEARTLDQAEYDARVHELGQLPGPQRLKLLLQAAGYRYTETAEITGSSCTAVNRHVTQGRARLLLRRGRT